MLQTQSYDQQPTFPALAQNEIKITPEATTTPVCMIWYTASHWSDLSYAGKWFEGSVTRWRWILQLVDCVRVSPFKLVETHRLVETPPSSCFFSLCMEKLIYLFKSAYPLPTYAASGAGWNPDVFTTPLAGEVRKHGVMWVQIKRLGASDSFIVLGKSCSGKFDPWKQRVHIGREHGCKCNLFSLPQSWFEPRFNEQSQHSWKTKAVLVSGWVMQWISVPSVKLVPFLNSSDEDFNWNLLFCLHASALSLKQNGLFWARRK